MASTVAAFADDLLALGLDAGDTVLVHSSLREIGAASRAGAAEILAALRHVLGERGTVVVPTFSSSNSTTSEAHLALIRGLSPAQVARFRAAMPAFDAANTPSESGWLSEQVRRTPGALRSGHPATSFAALGPGSEALLADHALDFYHGEGSPLGRLYDTPGARILLAGVGYGRCTALHLAENRVPGLPRRTYDFVLDDGRGPRWHTVESVALDGADFPALGAALEAVPGLVRRGRLGGAEARLLPMAPVVDFAVGWLGTHRRTGLAASRAEHPRSE